MLREESGLSDTLTRMRGNLDACRRTRVEVSEAQRLEHEIAGVYEAGQSMFAAALLATREEANESQRALDETRRAELTLSAQLRELDDSAGERSERHAALGERLAKQRTELELAMEGQAQLAHARGLVVERARLEAERKARDNAELLSRTEREQAASERAERLARRDRARQDYERSAQGLADVQKGLDELHRNAHRERRVKARVEQVREWLAEPDFVPAGAAAKAAIAAQELSRLDNERLRLAREVELFELHQHEHAQACAALSSIIAHPTSNLGHDRAEQELARLNALEEVATRATALASALRETEALAQRQVSARRKAEALGFEPGANPAGESLSVALTCAEDELVRCREARRDADHELATVSRDEAAAVSELEKLELATNRRKAAYALLNGIEPRSEPWALRDAEELLLRLEAEAANLREAAVRASGEREAALREAAELEGQGGSFHPELLRLRDEFDAELLVQRFEDLDPSQAPLLEARLGPLVAALVVSDPQAVAGQLRGRPRELQSIWLVASDARFESDIDAETDDVVVEHASGLRVTRIPDRPVLGRRARLARARAMRERVEELAAQLDREERRARRLALTLQELRPVVQDPELIGGERLVPLREACHSRLEELRARRRELELTGQRALAAEHELGPRVQGLRALLVDAFLLDGRDHSEAYRALMAGIAEGQAARRELERVAEPRRVLLGSLPALRFPAGSAGPLERTANERAELELARDRWFRIREALAEIQELAADFESNAQGRAEGTVSLIPALEEQHDRARLALAESEQNLERAEAAREVATLAWQQAEAERAALLAQCVRLDAELARLGVSDYAAFDLHAHDQRLAELRAEAERFDREEREISMNLALLAERRRELARALEAAWRTQKSAELAARPSEEAWQALRTRVTQGALGIPPHATLSLLEAPAPRPSAELWADARSKRELLLDRLGSAHSGAELVARLKAALGDDARRARGDAYLEAWLSVREFLGGRVPAQVADVQDPLEALERLRDHLFGLERRLARQESDLRGASEDIARSIEVQLRRAGSQVRRLNQSLTSIGFGSIRGIRVRSERVERMAQVLRALREGDAQELLFQPTLPIEDALNEIFRRYAGGRCGGAAHPRLPRVRRTLGGDPASEWRHLGARQPDAPVDRRGHRRRRRTDDGRAQRVGARRQPASG